MYPLLIVIITYLLIKYIFPILDLFLEHIGYLVGYKATKVSLETKSLVEEYNKIYPNKEQVQTDVIGFQMPENMELVEDDEEDSCKKVVGFKFNK